MVTTGDVKNCLGSQLMSHLIAEKTVGPKSPTKSPLASQKADGISGASGCPLGGLSPHRLWTVPVGSTQWSQASILPHPPPRSHCLSRSLSWQEADISRKTEKQNRLEQIKKPPTPLLSSRKHTVLVHKPHPGRSALSVSALLIRSTAPTTNHTLPPPTDNNPDSRPATRARQTKN